MDLISEWPIANESHSPLISCSQSERRLFGIVVTRLISVFVENIILYAEQRIKSESALRKKSIINARRVY